MASIVPNAAKESILDQQFDWSGNTYKLALLSDSYTPDVDNDVFFSDVSADEISGTGYTAGGETLSGLLVVRDDANDQAYLDANDVSWSNATFSTQYACIYESTGVPSTSKIVCIADYGQVLSPFNGDFVHQFASDGLIKLTS